MRPRNLWAPQGIVHPYTQSKALLPDTFQLTIPTNLVAADDALGDNDVIISRDTDKSDVRMRICSKLCVNFLFHQNTRPSPIGQLANRLHFSILATGQFREL